MKTCAWVNDGSNHYTTSCGGNFEVSNGSNLRENNFHYCVFCGERIKEYQSKFEKLAAILSIKGYTK